MASGRGLKKFRDVVTQQGGDPRVVDDPSRLPTAPHQLPIRAERAGYVGFKAPPGGSKNEGQGTARTFGRVR